MKAYGRVKGKIITFLTLALDEDEWSTSWLVPLSPYPNWLEGQMILVVNLDALETSVTLVSPRNPTAVPLSYIL